MTKVDVAVAGPSQQSQVVYRSVKCDHTLNAFLIVSLFQVICINIQCCLILTPSAIVYIID